MEPTNEQLVQLQRLSNGRVCLLGIGNRARRDDGAGSVVAAALQAARGERVIDAGTVPENYLEKLARTEPDTIIVVDAVDFGAMPGEWRVFDPERIAPAGISTHALSLRMTVQYLRARTAAKVILLAIQPASIGEGDTLSEPVARTVAFLRDTLPAILATDKLTAEWEHARP